MAVRHFVAYHNIDQRGVALSRARSGVFDTNKSGLPQKGDVLWCFEGAGRRLKEFRLVKRALIAGADRRASGDAQVRYQDADVLDVVANGMPWFKKLFDEQGRFAFGLNQISDNETIGELEGVAAGVLADAVEEDVDAISRDVSLSATTRRALIDARRGQGRFRSELDDYWGHACAVTNCKVRAVLRASHIKPWRLASNAERLDPANGIL